MSGGTGSGKTTLLNTLELIPSHERVLTIEDAAELQLQRRSRRAAGNLPAQHRRQGAIPARLRQKCLAYAS
ncbi:MAG: ATPase, T2SS/T4P/T4SS family [Planctomycetota bacterium]